MAWPPTIKVFYQEGCRWIALVKEVLKSVHAEAADCIRQVEEQQQALKQSCDASFSTLGFHASFRVDQVGTRSLSGAI